MTVFERYAPFVQDFIYAHRWEKLRFGPPCVRAGRKIYYRRDAVQDWLLAQEQERDAAASRAAPKRAGARR